MKILTSSLPSPSAPYPEAGDQYCNQLKIQELRFRDFVESVLYDPESGYYRKVAGLEDYATAGRISPVFGYALAELVSEFLGRTGYELTGIVDIGCGDGTLLERAIFHLPKVVLDRCQFWGIDRAAAPRASDERIRFARELSALPTDTPLLVLSNELFDALPFARLVKRADGLRELYVVSRHGALDWDERSAPPEIVEYFRSRGVELEEGQFADISLEWTALYGRICDLPNVRMIVSFDYGFPQHQLFDVRVRRFGTAAAYFRHQVHRDLLARPGDQDLTAHVNFSDLVRAGEERGFTTLRFCRQAEFLLSLGITEHPLFASADEVELDSLNQAVEMHEEREAARRLILPDGIGEDIRVLVQGRGIALEGWSFQREISDFIFQISEGERRALKSEI